MVAGAIGAILSILGLIKAQGFKGKKRWVFSAVFGLTLILSGWCFFTGWNNYAGIMFGVTQIPGSIDQDLMKRVEEKQVPLIEVSGQDELKKIFDDHDLKFLWLPCAKGGEWFKPSAFIVTKWTLPDDDVVCPNGRAMIKFTGKNG